MSNVLFISDPVLSSPRVSSETLVSAARTLRCGSLCRVNRAYEPEVL